MQNGDIILECLNGLQKNLIKYKYAGYDPYDVLNSPLFHFPILNKNKPIRFYSQQIFRRIPINLRPIIRIKKEVNPVTLGLAVQAYSYLIQIFPENKKIYLAEIDKCMEQLKRLSSKGYSGNCWGYNFDWEARYTKINKFVPTVVATGIITNGLFENYKLLKNQASKEIVIDAANFVLKDLNKYKSEAGICYSYSPVDNQRVFNASIKGARLLTQVYSITNDQTLLNEINALVNFVAVNQRLDGSWAYSDGDARIWSDNYHTAYVLDCLYEINNFVNIPELNRVIKKGLTFYKNSFFLEDGTPKYYNNKTHPIDATSGAQSILTLSRFGSYEQAEKVINWMIGNMYNQGGYFYYQKLKYYKHKTSYPRWSNAWMFLAISYYLYKVKNGKS